MVLKLVVIFAAVACVLAAPITEVAEAAEHLTPEQMESASTESVLKPSSAKAGADVAERPPPPQAPVGIEASITQKLDQDDKKLKIPAEDKLAITVSSSAKKEEALDLIIVIPTVRRFQRDKSPAPERYLAPMVDKIWYDMTSDQKQHVRFFILNSDKEPEKHEEAVSLGSHPGVTLFTKMAKKDEVVEKAISGYGQLEDGRGVSQSWLGWVASENVDAAFLFEKAKRQAPYILFMEDDVMPTTNLVTKLTKFVKNFNKDDWLFLDLYTPNLNWAEGMLDFSNGDKYNFQCCTQAMLFRSDRIDGVVDYLSQHPREPIDDNLRNYMRDISPGLVVYGLRPNLVEHVGAFSSNPEKSTGSVEHASLEFVPLLLQTDNKVSQSATAAVATP